MNANKPPNSQHRGAQFSLRGLIVTMAAICGTMAIVGALQVSATDVLLGFGIFGALAAILILVAEILSRVSRGKRSYRPTPSGGSPFAGAEQVDWIAERSEQLEEQRAATEGNSEHETSRGDHL